MGLGMGGRQPACVVTHNPAYAPLAALNALYPSVMTPQQRDMFRAAYALLSRAVDFYREGDVTEGDGCMESSVDWVRELAESIAASDPVVVADHRRQYEKES